MSFFHGSFERDDATSVTSVGRALGSGSVYSKDHPAYQRVADLVTSEVARISERDTARKSRATPVIMSLVLDAGTIDGLSRLFPEFRFLNYAQDKPGHVAFVACQTLANELLLHQAEKISSTVIHLGGSLMSSIMKSGVTVHLELDTSSASAVHSRQRDTKCVSRVMGDYATLTQDIGPNGARANYERYLRRQAYCACTRSSSCVEQAEVFCADLSTYSMSPSQFCTSMRQADASVGFGFFIYDPVMLLSASGELPGTGIHFEKSDGFVRIRYPEGVSGVELYPLSEWGAWLSEHTVRVGKGSACTVYQVQLTKTRGPFMFFQVTKVQGDPGRVTIRHALDLPLAESQYVVSSWSLRDLVSDPAKQASWVPSVFLAPAKVVDTLVSFGMQLEPESFSRYALRKQMKVLDRVTLEGSIVTRGLSLTRVQVDTLVTAVHADLFAKRYESGMLAKHMMERLKAVTGFANATSVQRATALASWHLTLLWDNTLGVAAESFTRMCDWLSGEFDPIKVHSPTLSMAPGYVSFETVSSTWRHGRGLDYAEAVIALETFQVTRSSQVLRGGVLSSALANFNGASAEVLLQSAKRVSDLSGMVDSYFRKHVIQSDVDDRAESVEAVDRVQSEVLKKVRELNTMDVAPVDRHVYPTTTVVRTDAQTMAMKPDFEYDVDYVGTMNGVYESFNPGVAQEPIFHDIASISHDDQDRNIVADWLRMPRLMDSYPKDRDYFMSKVLALGAPKRQETHQELLSSVAARNLAAPRIALPQDDSVLIPHIWDNFLEVMCVPHAKHMLESYQSDLVGLEEDAYKDWMSKSTISNLLSVRKELADYSQALDEMPVGEYLMMLKADVKPPLSDKPLRGRIEPQVIVYHQKALSGLYSSVFRVLVRRFLSLLKPEIHINLLKNSDDISGFIRSNHPYGEKLKYLENDFSKYDKSQDAFVFSLEAYVFRQLGMNSGLLDKWVAGHVDCSIRSLTTGLSLHLRYQRKSGDATTAFGNVILNVLSVAYAYAPTGIVWAVFMGDDSLLACRSVGHTEKAVRILAEVFNLTAKLYITDHPYFASNFVVVDDLNCHAQLVPDPVKWVEKRSQPVPAEDPQWHERFVSAADACAPYRHRMNTEPMASMVAARYMISQQEAASLVSAVASATSTEERFRACYQEQVERMLY